MATQNGAVPPVYGRAQLDHILGELAITLRPKEFDAACPPERDEDGYYCKNLLLKDRKGQFYLVVIPFHSEVNLKTLKSKVGAYRNFSFASCSDLNRLLNVEPGCVTPFAVFCDTNHELQVIIDASFSEPTINVHFHPLDANLTASISMENLLKFLVHLGYQAKFVDID